MDLQSYPAIDQHAHNVVRAEVADAWPYVQAFSEAHDPTAVAHARNTFFYRRSLRDIGELLECAPDEQSIVAKRKELGLIELARKSFTASNLEAVLLDDGFLPTDIHDLKWHRQFVPVKRVIRTETLAEDLLRVCDRFDDFEQRFAQALQGVASEVVAFKSIACYRSGLDIRPVSRDEARERFLALKRKPSERTSRLTDKTLVDYLLGVTLRISILREIPVQFHTGFGDPDLDLRLSNPLHLRSVLENPRYRGARIVLLHASYPFTREAGYLASVYPQVYLDMGLAVSFLSVTGMREVVAQLIELAPWSKVLYSSDAHHIPELFYLSAKWGRRVLGDVLSRAVRENDLTEAEAEKAARAVLSENAKALYAI